jgi:hypothetical protein
VAGHRITGPLNDDRGVGTVWVDGALCVRDGQTRTQTASARNTAGSLALLQALDHPSPEGDVSVVTDHLSSHTSGPIRAWLAEHPRLQQAFLPVGAAWRTLSEGRWRRFRRTAFAGASLADAEDSASVTRIATTQRNRQAKPWIWGRPPPSHRQLRRRFVYRL